jgi:hypothetical protein
VHDGLALLVRVASSHGPGLPPPYRALPAPTPAARLDVPLAELVRRLRALV